MNIEVRGQRSDYPQVTRREDTTLSSEYQRNLRGKLLTLQKKSKTRDLSRRCQVSVVVHHFWCSRDSTWDYESCSNFPTGIVVALNTIDSGYTSVAPKNPEFLLSTFLNVSDPICLEGQTVGEILEVFRRIIPRLVDIRP